MAKTAKPPVAEFSTMRVSALEKTPAPYNPRIDMEGEEFEALCRAIREFGLVEPCVFNKQTNTLVGGHQRVRAARAEGITQMPVMIVDLPKAREMQLNVALNKIQGEWDQPKLAAVFAEIEELGEDPTLTGFDQDEIRLIAEEWDHDFAEHERTASTDSALRATILVHCSQDDYETVLAAVERAVGDLRGLSGPVDVTDA